MDREELARRHREEINRLRDAQLVDYLITWAEGQNDIRLKENWQRTIRTQAQLDGNA